MSQFDDMKNRLSKGAEGELLKKIAKIPEVAKLRRSMNMQALEKAASAGDSAAVSEMLNRALGTREGQALVKRINEDFGNK